MACIFLAVAFACSPASARGLKDYQRTVWTQQDGAPSDISGLAQTTDGWLWVGSGDGLFRFDGVSFTPYKPPGYPELAHMRVVEMYAADNGDLYVSYFPKDVAIVRPDGSFELLPQPEELRRIIPSTMVVDADDTLWTVGHGIRRFANGRWTTVENDPAWATEGFYSMLVDQDGGLWAAESGGVWRLDRARGRFTKVSQRGGGLALAPNGDVWLLGLEGGPSVLLAVSAVGKARPPRAAAAVSRLGGQFASDGTLWALGCPHTACLIYDTAKRGATLLPANDADERLPRTSEAAGPEPLGMIEDQEGNLWVLAHNGLNRFRPKRFLVPGFDLADIFYSAASDGAGNVWVAETVSGKLWRIGPDGTPVRQPGPAVHMLASGRNGSLLMADKRTIRRVRNGVVETIPLPPGPDGKPRDRQLLGILDDGKRLWSGSTDLGSIAWSDGRWQTSAEIGLPSRIYLSQAGGIGQLWLALATGELVLHDNGKLTHYDLKPIGIATGIFPGKQVTVGGTDGLAVIKDGALHRLHSAEPDVLRGVSGLAVTADGDRWLNGVAGVVHVRAADWQRAVDRPDEPLRYELFGVVDGYPGRSSIQNRRPTAMTSDGRHVWFIATRGIVGLDSANLRRNTVAPGPVIQEVRTDKASFATYGDVVLPAGSDSFRLRFTAPALRQPERTRFEYCLDGVDADWRDAGTSRSTSYTNVAPGGYVFRVRAINEDGVVSGRDATVRLTVKPTLVQSLPFRIAVALALAGMLVTLYRLRVRYLTGRLIERLQIKLTERERIARTLHDTFLQTVQALLLRLVKFERTFLEDGRARRELQTILDQAQHAINEGRHQVQELRLTTVRTLEDVVQECADALRTLHPEIEFVLRSEGTARGLYPAMVDEAGAIVSEAIRNAFAHARAQRILVHILHGRHGLVATVQDDGIGLAPDIARTGYRSGHWGLIGMRERAERVGARLDIDSSAETGTAVALSIPAARAYAEQAA